MVFDYDVIRHLPSIVFNKLDIQVLMSKGKNIFFLFLLALGLGNIFVNYISEPPAKNRLFDSDALYLPTLFSDIFANNGQIKDWFLTPAPYFFPDYPIFFLVYLVGATPYSQIIAFALIQAALTFFAIWLVARATANRPIHL